MIIAVDRSCRFTGSDYRESSMLFGAQFLGAQAELLEGAAPDSLRFTREQTTPEQAAAWSLATASTTRVFHDLYATAVLITEAKQLAAMALLSSSPHESDRAGPQSIALHHSRLMA